jgi:hypothetical protein
MIKVKSFSFIDASRIDSCLNAFIELIQKNNGEIIDIKHCVTEKISGTFLIIYNDFKE